MDREGAAVIAASRQGTLCRAAIAFALVALSVPGLARAQEESEPNEEDGAAEGAATDGSEYEPDQRGEHDEQEAAGGGVSYEPDQRGEHDEAEQESAPGVATVAASDVGYGASSDGGLGLDLQVWLGAGVLGVDAAGGDNLVRSSQHGSIAGTFGLAAGLRVGPVVVGPRVGFSIDATMLLLNTAIGADVFLLDGPIAPYVRASIGLSMATPLGDRLAGQAEADILGLGVEAGVGVRWRTGGGFFLGLELSGGWHHLWREALPSCTTECTDGELDLRRAGESDALTLRLALSAGWAF